jgi:DNA-binding NarL/FixJ family response regulator
MSGTGDWCGRRPRCIVSAMPATASRLRDGCVPLRLVHPAPSSDELAFPARVGVVIADTKGLVRAGLRALIDAGSGLTVVGEAADVDEAVAMARRLRPAVLLVGTGLPDADGVRAARQIAADPELSGVSVMLLTAYASDDLVLAALRAGVGGLLLTDTGPHELVDAVRAVADGDGVLPPRVTRRLMDTFAARTLEVVAPAPAVA